MLVIAFPLYLFMTMKTTREIAANPINRESRVRRWLTYLTLFIAVMVIIGDLAALVYQLLRGELTARIGLKVLVVAVIAGAIFTYYLRSVRRDEAES
jgi:hypothetical protein